MKNIVYSLILALSIFPMFSATIIVLPGTSTDIQNAINAASDGDAIILGEGTFTITDTITVNKQITLQGVGTNRTFLIQQAGVGSDSSISITVSNVTLRDFEIQHLRQIGNDNAIGTSPNLENIRLLHLVVRSTDLGIVINFSQFQLSNCTFYYVGNINSKHHMIAVYGNLGTSLISDNGFVPSTIAHTVFLLLSDVGNSVHTGSLHINGNIQQSPGLFQFSSMESFAGATGAFALSFARNIFTANGDGGNLTFYQGDNNAFNLFSTISVFYNTIGNTDGINKGIIAIDGFNAGLNVASNPNNIFLMGGNIFPLTTITNAAGYTGAAATGLGLIGYNSDVYNAFTVVLAPFALQVTPFTQNFPTQIDLINAVGWRESDTTLKGFNLYRNSPTNLIGKFGMQETVVFDDHQQQTAPTFYYVESFNASGTKSRMMQVSNINPRR